MNVSAGKGGPRPRMLMCYLCGREFGSKSLPIHMPQCQKKWLDVESLKPLREQRPMPKPPTPEVPIKIGGNPQAVDDFNEAAYKQFQASLEQCPHCRRKFAPEAYKHHQKSCTESNPAKPAGTALIPQSLSNNKWMQPYTKAQRAKNSVSKPAAASRPQSQMKKMIVEARAQKEQGEHASRHSGAKEGNFASTSKTKPSSELELPLLHFSSFMVKCEYLLVPEQLPVSARHLFIRGIGEITPSSCTSC